jgi:hypothetical protein
LSAEGAAQAAQAAPVHEDIAAVGAQDLLVVEAIRDCWVIVVVKVLLVILVALAN